jgi:N-acetylglutamate synthase-like GNAT family acetyltransferase
MSPAESPAIKLSKIVSFVTRELRPNCEWTIQDEYPHVFQERNIHNLKYIEKEGTPVTHAALKPIIIKTPQLLYKVAAIGSVVTHSSYRGQGLSSQVISECLKEATQQDCDLAILWTNLHDFYRRLGFELCGFEEYFNIVKPLKCETTQLHCIKSRQVDPEAILKLYNRHTITSVRTSEEVRKFMNIPNTEVYTAWDSSNAIKAYAVIGKGADLEGFAHEWGGDINHLFHLFNFILEERQKPFTILVGAHSVNLIMALQKQKIHGQQGYLGMIKILNLAKFSKKLEKVAKIYGIKNFSISEIESGKVLVTANQSRLFLENSSQLVQLIFGPSTLLSSKPDLENEFHNLFPLPLWVWGWDSI